MADVMQSLGRNMDFVSRSSFWTPEYIVDSPWLEHAPFAFWLMEIQRPRVLVELGVYRGFSYFCFCQAIEQLGLDTRAYAIDIWQGDEFDGFCGQDVFQELSSYHDRYAPFSRLIRSGSGEALEHFVDGSVDLLHIGGSHLHDGVEGDFESWRRKLSRCGVVLFHGINSRQSDFSLFEFWQQIKNGHPHFQFTHGHGLGVLGVGSEQPEELTRLFGTSGSCAVQTRAAYAKLGQSVAARFSAKQLAAPSQAEPQPFAEAELAIANQLHEAELAAAARRLQEAKQKEQYLESKVIALSEALNVAAAQNGTARAELARARIELDHLHGALWRARKKPGATALRYYKWRTSKYLAKLGPLMGTRFAKRMLRRRQKNAPDFLVIFQNAAPFAKSPVRTARSRHRKWRQTKAILAFSPVLPASYIAKMRRRLEKNAPLSQHGQLDCYSSWIKQHGTLSRSDRERIRYCAKLLPRKPLISIIMPVFNTPPEWLEKAIESVRGQLYDNWELCIADDASTEGHVRKILTRCAAAGSRIKVHFRKNNGHISACSNDALALATGDYIGLLDHDDELHETALFHVALEINKHPKAGIIFSDEDKIDISGKRKEPYFKCGFSYDLFLAQNLISHFGVYESKLVRAAGGFRVGFEGSQDWDLALRVLEKCGQENVRHIPRVLYHWRTVESSASASAKAKPYAKKAGLLAVREHLDRMNIDAEVVANPNFPDSNRIRYNLRRTPLVSIIIPTFNGFDILKTCITSIQERTLYNNFEILVVDNRSTCELTISYMQEISARKIARILKYNEAFNYSAINNFAVAQARGEIIVLLNNDTEVISDEWLDELVSHAMRPEIGAVGALLLFPDQSIQHAGVIVGLGGVAGHAHLNFPGKAFGYFGRAQIPNNVSAVTGACLAIRKGIFEEVGGLDEKNLPVAYNDIDFCLRVAEKGYRNIYTPYALLYHHESKTRGLDITPEKRRRFEGECAYMLKRHAAAIVNDPLYNPNLTLRAPDYSLSSEPRILSISQLCKQFEMTQGAGLLNFFE